MKLKYSAEKYGNNVLIWFRMWWECPTHVVQIAAVMSPSHMVQIAVAMSL